jgi:hypothetical protein
VGIDEGKALVMQGRQARVAGASQVVRLAHPVRLRTEGSLLRMQDAEFSTYGPGDTFQRGRLFNNLLLSKMCNLSGHYFDIIL